MVDMLESGCFRAIQDVQCFDLRAVQSIRENPAHMEITAAQYASPEGKSTAASSLDAVVLGATEIDTDFNVNVHTDSNGYIIGGSGGHTDVAAEAKLTMIVAPLSRARMSIVVDRVLTVSTPGSSVDLLVTQYGIAVNPARPDLKAALEQARLPVGRYPRPAPHGGGNQRPCQTLSAPVRPVVAQVLGRDSRVQDVIYAVPQV